MSTNKTPTRSPESRHLPYPKMPRQPPSDFVMADLVFFVWYHHLRDVKPEQILAQAQLRFPDLALTQLQIENVLKYRKPRDFDLNRMRELALAEMAHRQGQDSRGPANSEEDRLMMGAEGGEQAGDNVAAMAGEGRHNAPINAHASQPVMNQGMMGAGMEGFHALANRAANNNTTPLVFAFLSSGPPHGGRQESVEAFRAMVNAGTTMVPAESGAGLAVDNLVSRGRGRPRGRPRGRGRGRGRGREAGTGMAASMTVIKGLAGSADLAARPTTNAGIDAGMGVMDIDGLASRAANNLASRPGMSAGTGVGMMNGSMGASTIGTGMAAGPGTIRSAYHSAPASNNAGLLPPISAMSNRGLYIPRAGEAEPSVEVFIPGIPLSYIVPRSVLSRHSLFVRNQLVNNPGRFELVITTMDRDTAHKLVTYMTHDITYRLQLDVPFNGSALARIEGLIRLYYGAKSLQMAQLQDLAIAYLMHGFEQNSLWPSKAQIKLVYSQSLSDTCKLRLFFARACAYMILHVSNIDPASPNFNNQASKDEIRELGAEFEALKVDTQWMLGQGIDVTSTPYQMVCEYHVHQLDDESCPWNGLSFNPWFDLRDEA